MLVSSIEFFIGHLLIGAYTAYLKPGWTKFFGFFDCINCSKPGVVCLALTEKALIAGSIAAVTGFGIGSLVTPVLSLSLGTKLSIALVSLPHFIATALRFWMLRAHVDRHVLLGFGFMGLSGFSQKMKFHGGIAWLAGGLSGILGGLVGNQGGIRSAALLGFTISKESFVATATAIGLIVDSARMPVYFYNEGKAIWTNWKWIMLTTIGVVVGTFIGTRFLKRLPEQIFRRVVSALIFFLGAFMLYRGINEL